MQLVNLEIPQSIISNELISAIQSGDLSKSKELLRDIEDYNTILRSYYLLSIRPTGIKNYLNSTIVYTDAISELIQRLFPEDPQLVLEASIEYFCSIKYIDEDLSLPKPVPQDISTPVVVKALSEAIANGDTENAFKISKKLLAVMDSKDYFTELLMEEAAKSYTENGVSIIIINSVRKAMQLFDYKMIDELIWYALSLLTSEDFRSRRKIITPSTEEIMYSEYVLKAASVPGANGENLLFIGHARQTYKAASVKHKEIWAYLSAFIQTKFDKVRIEELEEIEPVKGDIVDFEKSLEIKDLQLTMTFVNQILKSEVNVGELFGTMALALVENGSFKNPEMVIFLNMARRLSTALDYPRNLLVYKSFIKYLYSNNILD